MLRVIFSLKPLINAIKHTYEINKEDDNRISDKYANDIRQN